MRKLLLIFGILCILVCVLFILFALLNMHGYYNLYDGTAEHYAGLHHKMVVSFIVGTVFAVIGAVCIIIRSKI